MRFSRNSAHRVTRPATPTNIGRTVQGPGRTISLHGEFDFGNCDQLRKATSAFAERCVKGRRRRPRSAAKFENPAAISQLTVLDALHDAVVNAVIDADRLDHGDAVLDASDVQFIDAASLGVLVLLHHTLADNGIRLQTRRPSPIMRRASAACGLDGILGLDPAADKTMAPTGSCRPQLASRGGVRP